MAAVSLRVEFRFCRRFGVRLHVVRPALRRLQVRLGDPATAHDRNSHAPIRMNWIQDRMNRMHRMGTASIRLVLGMLFILSIM
jgi:hypothetical protein